MRLKSCPASGNKVIRPLQGLIFGLNRHHCQGGTKGEQIWKLLLGESAVKPIESSKSESRCLSLFPNAFTLCRLLLEHYDEDLIWSGW